MTLAVLRAIGITLSKRKIFSLQPLRSALLFRRLSDGVTVAQSPLEALVMVRIHVGQPALLRKMSSSAFPAQILPISVARGPVLPFNWPKPQTV